MKRHTGLPAINSSISAAAEGWLQRLQKDHPVPAKGLTKGGIRKMIARLHEELAVYEGGQEVKQPEASS